MINGNDPILLTPGPLTTSLTLMRGSLQTARHSRPARLAAYLIAPPVVVRRHKNWATNTTCRRVPFRARLISVQRLPSRW